MPNHCSNHIILSGSNQSVNAIIALISKSQDVEQKRDNYKNKLTKLFMVAVSDFHSFDRDVDYSWLPIKIKVKNIPSQKGIACRKFLAWLNENPLFDGSSYSVIDDFYTIIQPQNLTFNSLNKRSKKIVMDFTDKLCLYTRRRMNIWHELDVYKSIQVPSDDIMFENIISKPALVVLNPSDVNGSYLNHACSERDYNHDAFGTRCDSGFGLSIKNNTDKDVTIDFYTVYTPPEPVILRLVTLFPDVNVTHLFWDEGAGFAGFKKFENGVMIDEHVDEICFIEAEFAEGEFQESPVYPYFMEEILNK